MGSILSGNVEVLDMRKVNKSLGESMIIIKNFAMFVFAHKRLFYMS